jgi:DNA repair protein RadA/Sms
MRMKTRYICNNCEYEQPKWLGRCPNCETFNSFEQVIVRDEKPGKKLGGAAAARVQPASRAAGKKPPVLADISHEGGGETRVGTGIGELNRVLGGGIVAGSVVLLGGDPGIGKSTLLLQVCKFMAGADFRVLYVSGEESTAQIKMRADRLTAVSQHVYMLAETDANAIADAVAAVRPSLMIIDSIQTMRLAEVSSLPGSVTQVRECAAFFTTLAKQGNMACILVGHVTKEGGFAGPRVLEHMVDTVLYFEGESRGNAYRLVRAVKNRFGGTHEVGVFQMTEQGLMPIDDPSAFLLAGRPVGAAGSVITCTMEGTRPLLVEVQGLVSHTTFAAPRRTATGVDYNRMVMLLAVLEKRGGISMSNFDAYVNIAGGMKIDEPAADAAIIAAIASCHREKPLPDGIIIFGEVGLSGELRSVPHPQHRVNEAARHGFTHAIIPAAAKKIVKPPTGFTLLAAADIKEMLTAVV